MWILNFFFQFYFIISRCLVPLFFITIYLRPLTPTHSFLSFFLFFPPMSPTSILTHFFHFFFSSFLSHLCLPLSFFSSFHFPNFLCIYIYFLSPIRPLPQRSVEERAETEPFFQCKALSTAKCATENFLKKCQTLSGSWNTNQCGAVIDHWVGPRL